MAVDGVWTRVTDQKVLAELAAYEEAAAAHAEYLKAKARKPEEQPGLAG